MLIKGTVTTKRPKNQNPAQSGRLTLEQTLERYTARFRDREADWEAFADSKIKGYRRAQHRFIGAGGSGKHGESNVIPPGAFTLSIMYVPPGEGSAPHTHEVEEVFFVLKGYLTAFLEDETGRRVSVKLGPWECISCPAHVVHGYKNESLEPVYFQTMLGKGRPDLIGYTDAELFNKRGAHLKKHDSDLAQISRLRRFDRRRRKD